MKSFKIKIINYFRVSNERKRLKQIERFIRIRIMKNIYSKKKITKGLRQN